MLRDPTTVPSTPATALGGGAGVAARLVAGFLGLLRRSVPFLLILAAFAALVYEYDTSSLQSRIFSDYAARVSYRVEPGTSERIAFPNSGPFDRRRGYSALPTFLKRLDENGFRIAQQARVTPELQNLVAWGISPPYPEVADVGLIIGNPDGSTLLDASPLHGAFTRFADIPPLIVASLLFIENRELLAPWDARRSPVLEWDRLARAGLLYGASKVGLHVDRAGGSTLAIQLEKYRYSPNGRTGSAAEKLRQIIGASLKAYDNGPDTNPRRHEIVVDYLNTMPLAAAPGYGEVYGLGEGLHAWFGLESEPILDALRSDELTPAKALAFKHALALIVSVRAPTHYLMTSHDALERRIDQYVNLMLHEGIIDSSLAAAAQAVPLAFVAQTTWQPTQSFVEKKSLNAVRSEVMNLLGVDNSYDLSRLHLHVNTTIDPIWQREITNLLTRMTDREFVRANGLQGERLLRTGDPAKVQYSFVLYESTPGGNVERVHADSFDGPFDINDGTKMELGSTAKLRTLAHYLDVVAEVQSEFRGLPPAQLKARAAAADPITAWVATTMTAEPEIELAKLLDLALERPYATSPYEAFFTGGGLHSFANFKRSDHENGKQALRVALQQSINLVFIRLMRDLVRYHQARLPYDAAAVMHDTNNPTRKQMLGEIADEEGRAALRRSYRRYQHLSETEIIARLLGKRATSARSLTVLFFAWKIGSTRADLAAWLTERLGTMPQKDVDRLYKAYSNPRLVLADYGYLLSVHPLDLWCADEMRRNPKASMAEILERGAGPRSATASWLFKSRNRRAQDVRLRNRIEVDAFTRMTPYWQRLGFPFEHLVPSLATAIGSSADRPSALADLMGIIVNDGVRRPLHRLVRLDFAEGTPYETTVVPDPLAGERVLEPEVAAALRSTLAGVVESGTARRLRGSFTTENGEPIVAGGKTGSGDNRFETYHRGGGVISSRPINRTATFVYFLGDRHFGVLTAHVAGKIAGNYEFTSALPVSVLKLAAPILNPRIQPRHDPILQEATHHEAPGIES